jgi:hypothetical protein
VRAPIQQLHEYPEKIGRRRPPSSVVMSPTSALIKAGAGSGSSNIELGQIVDRSSQPRIKVREVVALLPAG